ncbi:MAG: acetyltransferase [Flavobacteriia bacterium]|mgnify:CR=1 FL=1|nr:acetyltransferase [Flavobacteriia bacterium]
MYLFGASGHGKVVAEIAEEHGLKIEAVIDEDSSKTQLLEYKVTQNLPEDHSEMLISIGNNQNRKKIAERYPNFNYIKLIHSGAHISKRAKIGEGTVIMAGAVINSETKIGKHCIINSNSVIEHECEIGDYVHISPGAALAGNVSVGEGSQIGIGASVIQGIKIGKWCIIGAGAVIIRDVPDGVTVVGNPGRIIG